MDAIKAGPKVDSSYKMHLKILEGKFDSAKAHQGFIGKAWNGFKEAFKVGQSEKDCEKMLDKYKSGRISFNEAVEYIEAFETKQQNMTNLLSNITTGVGAITATTIAAASGPIGWGAALAFGAPVGAALKTGINLFDRATNKIDDDEFNAKTMAKDVISGALTGMTSAVSSGVGAGIKAGKFGLTVKNGVKCGIECGALSGSLGYMTDVAFQDEEFSLGQLAKNTLTSATVSGTVGAVVGAGMYGISNVAGTVGKDVAKSTARTIVQDSTSSSTRKVLGQVERDVAGVAIGAIAANTTNKPNIYEKASAA